MREQESKFVTDADPTKSLVARLFVSEVSRRRDVLSRLPEKLLAQLFAAAIPLRLRAGKILFSMGERGDGCYHLERGLLKVLMTSPDGEEQILAFLGPGSIAGELALIDGQPRSASIFAVTDCELNFVSHAAFVKCTEQDPEIFRYLVGVLTARLRETDEALAASSFLNVKARIARALLELSGLFGDDRGGDRIVIRHKVTQKDLAAMAGTGRENVSRALREWERRGIVTRMCGCYNLHVAALRNSVRS